jgi:hypothetical protein
MKNSNDIIWYRTRILPACSAVPEPTAPPLESKVAFSPLLLAGKWVRTGSSCRTFLNKTTGRPEDSAGFWNCNCGEENEGTNTTLFLGAISASSIPCSVNRTTKSE